ncbi:hypothetical protein F5Y09DRAFT_12407 [Xylaria sp. FL1042]|nr:hypothetical protein F5Y09DRAFT_12407 [Xylaria sp. FL1042]
MDGWAPVVSRLWEFCLSFRYTRLKRMVCRNRFIILFYIYFYVFRCFGFYPRPNPHAFRVSLETHVNYLAPCSFTAYLYVLTWCRKAVAWSGRL